MKENYIFVESESKWVGSVIVLNEIFEVMIWEGYYILLECDIENRVDRFCRDYIYDKDEGNILILKECINKFRKRLGNKVVDDYIDLLELGEYKEFVKRYFLEYYDLFYMYLVEKYKYSKIINFNDI